MQEYIQIGNQSYLNPLFHLGIFTVSKVLLNCFLYNSILLIYNYIHRSNLYTYKYNILSNVIYLLVNHKNQVSEKSRGNFFVLNCRALIKKALFNFNFGNHQSIKMKLSRLHYFQLTGIFLFSFFFLFFSTPGLFFNVSIECPKTCHLPSGQ